MCYSSVTARKKFPISVKGNSVAKKFSTTYIIKFDVHQSKYDQPRLVDCHKSWWQCFCLTCSLVLIPAAENLETISEAGKLAVWRLASIWKLASACKNSIISWRQQRMMIEPPKPDHVPQKPNILTPSIAERWSWIVSQLFDLVLSCAGLERAKQSIVEEG